MLQIDTDSMLNLTTQSFVGCSVALLGITGSGKTNTAAVLIEELLTQGLPMTIVDIEGEYWGLKEKYDLLIAGRSEHAELEIGPENAAQLAEISVQRGISVILDLSEYDQDETYDFLVSYFTRLWQVASSTKQPYQIILEEAHEWIPQGVRTPLKQILTRIALRGRKRGLGIILMSQRSAKVEKDVLTQAALLFLHKVVHPIDLKVYKDLIPLPSSEVEHIIGALHPGQVVVISNHVAQVTQIRWRYTFHAGSTPEFGTVVQPELKRIDESMLKELQAMIATSSPEKTGNNEAKLTKKVKELEGVIAAKDAEIAQLKDQVALLSKLSVSSPDTLEIKQATVHRLVANGAIAPATVVEAVPATNNHRVAVQEIAPPLNESKFNSLKKRLEVVPILHLRELNLLTEKGYPMRTSEIAAWLNLSESRIQGNLPVSLMRLKLIGRYKDGRTVTYESLLKEFLAKEFPGANVEMLVKRLL